MDKLDVVKLWARHYFHPDDGDDDDDDDDDELNPKARTQTFLGVPFAQLGTMQMEGIGQLRYAVDGPVLDEMISLEGDETWGPVLRESVTPLRPVRQDTKRKPAKLIGVDRLVMREGVKRELGMWEHWVRMMVWGWHDHVGRRMPLWNEKQLMRMRKGLPPVELAVASRDAPNDGENGSKTEDVPKNED